MANKSLKLVNTQKIYDLYVDACRWRHDEGNPHLANSYFDKVIDEIQSSARLTFDWRLRRIVFGCYFWSFQIYTRHGMATEAKAAYLKADSIAHQLANRSNANADSMKIVLRRQTSLSLAVEDPKFWLKILLQKLGFPAAAIQTYLRASYQYQNYQPANDNIDSEHRNTTFTMGKNSPDKYGDPAFESVDSIILYHGHHHDRIKSWPGYQQPNHPCENLLENMNPNVTVSKMEIFNSDDASSLFVGSDAKQCKKENQFFASPPGKRSFNKEFTDANPAHRQPEKTSEFDHLFFCRSYIIRTTGQTIYLRLVFVRHGYQYKPKPYPSRFNQLEISNNFKASIPLSENEQYEVRFTPKHLMLDELEREKNSMVRPLRLNNKDHILISYRCKERSTAVVLPELCQITIHNSMGLEIDSSFIPRPIAEKPNAETLDANQNKKSSVTDKNNSLSDRHVDTHHNYL
ncbi:hypothetical protein TrispH2_011039 [Trichoplax sp. H2]|nr:hypothetical protein TrispH2_011039 [Trichoplax sp. H2]|eukprot:RDD37826.1 hypothetical protein TrispH2_011039 [Trichoplax sp. H2]